MPTSPCGLFCLLVALMLGGPAGAQSAPQPPPRTLHQLAQELRALGKEFDALGAAGRLDEADAVAGRMERVQRECLSRIAQERATLDSLRATFANYLATMLSFRADRAEERDDLDAALAARREAVDLRAQGPGKPGWEFADARRLLADLERLRSRTPQERRDLVEARRLGREVLRLSREGKWSEGLALAEKALAIRERLLGKDSPDYAASLSNLADLYDSLGDKARAEAGYRRALEIRRRSQGEDHPSYAQALHNLAYVVFNRGDDDRAEALYLQALAIEERVLGKTHPLTVDTHSNLGGIYFSHGDYDRAAPMLTEALRATGAVLGESHPEYATRLINLAALDHARGDDARAEARYRQALAIRKTAQGDKGPSYAAALNELATLHFARGEYTKAEPLLKDAAEIYRQALGESHPSYARCLHNLAGVYQARGEFARAEPLYRRALAIRKAALGEDHPSCARTLEDLAILLAAQGRWAEAIEDEDRARRAFRGHIRHVLPTLSERQQLLFLGEVDRTSLWTAFSLGLAGREAPDAPPRSAEWVLNGKALAQQSLSERALLLREGRDASLSQAVRQLQSVRSRLARAAVSPSELATAPGQDRPSLLKSLDSQERELESRLSQARGLPHRDDPWVTVDEVRKALPADSILVEIARFGVFDFRHGDEPSWWRAPRYAAWLLPPAGAGEIRLIDLGPAAAIEKSAAEYRKVMRDAGPTIARKGEAAAEAELRKPLLDLAQRVLRPLEPFLAKFPRWQISPDAALWLVPWGVLPLADGSYALEGHAINYLVSGRDLVATSRASAIPRVGVLVADPDFDLVAAARPEPSEAKPLERGLSRASSTPIPTNWPRLPGTSEEAELILPSLEHYLGAKPAVLTGAEAAEANVKRTRRPRVFVLCTHGFFLPDQIPEALPRRGEPAAESSRSRPMENPLLRCGLVLAGANQRLTVENPEGDDGILTGLEVVGIDLRGTELVVLSACETGLGDLRQGEGIAGLRQAFQLAGARSVIASLWQIPDEETVELMVKYWEQLSAGRDFADALHLAQRAVIRARREAGRAAHPWFWAAFSLTGPIRASK